ncbi:MAG: hypothetical protein O3B37_07450, partial [Proteobacteria bacterium]|nr:hypothetical protein [Pseudomonadota bacterium]
MSYYDLSIYFVWARLASNRGRRNRSHEHHWEMNMRYLLNLAFASAVLAAVLSMPTTAHAK